VTGLDPGAHFAGHRIEALIGRGGMGEVYRAVHLGLERTVALKVVTPNLAEEEGIRERFRRECRLAAAIDHPAAVPIYDSGEFEGRLYVTMRLVQGPDLGRQVRRDGPLAPEWAAELSARAAEAIDAAHRHGLVHRDIKPANLLLEAAENDVRVFVGDFGLAKLLDDSTGPTKTGTWLGTVDYAAPETLAGKGAGPAADVYGLGGVLYTALTGRAPYVRDTLSGVMWAHTNDPPPQLGDLRHPATDALNDVIGRAMAKQPTERFGSGAELAGALRAAVPDGERHPFALAPAMAASAETETSAETRAAEEGSTPKLPRSRITLSRRAALIAGAAAAVVVAALAVILLTGGGPVDAKRFTAEMVPMPNGSGGISIAGDSLWSIGHRQLIPVHAGKASKPMALDGQPVSLVADGNDLWLAYDDGVQRYDAAKRQPVGGMIDIDTDNDTRMVSGMGGIWVSYPIGDTIVRIDPETSRPDRKVSIPQGVGGPLAIGEGRLWVVNAEYGGSKGGVWVTPVDDRGRVGRPIHVDGAADDTVPAIAAGGGSVWVGDHAANAIRRIDPASHRVSPERIRLSGGSLAMEFADGAVFALDGDGENLLIVDPSTGEATGPAIPVGGGKEGDVAVDDGSVWVSNVSRLSLLRLSW
jgi:hypothetical protein